MAAVSTNLGRVVIGDRFIAAASLFLRLFQNDFTPDVDTVWADLTEADFDGYTEWVVEWSPTILDGDVAKTTAGLHTFLATGGTTPNDIYGWALVTGVGGGGDVEIILAERFAGAPITIDAAGEHINVTVQIQWTNAP